MKKIVILIAALLALGACDADEGKIPEATPLVAPAVPRDTATTCLGPAGTHIRLIISDTNGRKNTSAVNVANLPPTNPWSCP